jgi:transposase
VAEGRATVARQGSDPGATARDNRLFLEAVLWRVRTGAPWRDLPSDFGRWNSVFQRFRRWVKGGVFERIFGCLSDEPDFEYAMIDGTIVTAHQKASGARGGLKIQQFSLAISPHGYHRAS